MRNTSGSVAPGTFWGQLDRGKNVPRFFSDIELAARAFAVLAKRAEDRGGYPPACGVALEYYEVTEACADCVMGRILGPGARDAMARMGGVRSIPR